MSRERLWSGTGQVAVQSCAGSTTMSWNTARKALGFEACLQLQLHSAKSRPHPYRNGSSYLKLLPPALGGSTCLTLYLFRAETSIWSREDWATDASQLPRLPHLENVSESRKRRNRQHRITCLMYGTHPHSNSRLLIVYHSGAFWKSVTVPSKLPASLAFPTRGRLWGRDL